MSEPAELFTYDAPAQGAPQLSRVLRENFEAVARCFYTTNPTYPLVARKGMPRILDDNSGVGVKLQWYTGTSWQTIIPGLENFAATGKVIYPFTAQTNLVIDHNLGSYPVVQVLDSSNYLVIAGGGAGGGSYDVVDLVQFQTPVAVSTKSVWRVPAALDGVSLDDVSFGVYTAGTGGDCTFQVTHDPVDGSPDVDLLTPVATILAGERTSKVGVQPVVAVNTLAEGDFLVFKVLTMGATSAPLGLQVGMSFSGGSGTSGSYTLRHISPNRVQLIFPVATSGTVVLIG